MNKRRAALHAKSPHCIWCGRETLLVDMPPKGTHARMATVDHLVSRNLGRKVGETTVTVLACYACNVNRAEAEQRGISLTIYTMDNGHVFYQYGDKAKQNGLPKAAKIVHKHFFPPPQLESIQRVKGVVVPAELPLGVTIQHEVPPPKPKKTPSPRAKGMAKWSSSQPLNTVGEAFDKVLVSKPLRSRRTRCGAFVPMTSF